MNRHLLILALVFGSVCVSHAGPDEEFSEIVKLVQHGDQLIEQGKDRTAMNEYRKAQNALLKFREVYPDWDNQVVSFRMRYLSDRLGNWTEPAQTRENSPDAEVQALRNRINFLERSGKQYQAQINQLVSENNRLSSRLREALAIRPAAEDPAVVADTRASLEKKESENTSLKARVKELETQLAAIPKPDEARKNARLVDELRENLNRTLADAESLRKQNASLREAASKMTNAPLKTDTDDDQLQAQVVQSAAAMEIQRLKNENKRLQVELAALQNRPPEHQQSQSQARDGFGANDRARLALANHRYKEAVELLAAELKSSPDNTEAWYLLGLAHMANDDFKEAEADLKKALSLKPDLGTAHVELARLYLRKSPPDPALARWHYHKAVELNFPRDEALERSLDWEQPEAPR